MSGVDSSEPRPLNPQAHLSSICFLLPGLTMIRPLLVIVSRVSSERTRLFNGGALVLTWRVGTVEDIRSANPNSFCSSYVRMQRPFQQKLQVHSHATPFSYLLYDPCHSICLAKPM